ncbi:HNH endonuclease signature motif containing protein [Priestia megaterium]|uniref:HNH endonuclease n=1 Tax=Priestia megaterium TaxID=1404 RepID=UPI002E1AE0F4|nr:HNH endonuclease signature motif containing protein [Priestia megaterium]MED4278305.1 HNH endonuclease signature motif containing protein [Priestia megaterium]MED4314410.1 HNH endonuclease signature motif containing protein [Priestia megaterium]
MREIIRPRILKRDNGICLRCWIKFNRRLTTDNLELHHIKSWRDYPELAYEESNLIIVCKSCNLELGNSNKLDFPVGVLEEETFI